MKVLRLYVVAQSAAAVVAYLPLLSVVVEPMVVQPWNCPFGPRLWMNTLRLALTGVVVPVRWILQPESVVTLLVMRIASSNDSTDEKVVGYLPLALKKARTRTF